MTCVHRSMYVFLVLAVCTAVAGQTKKYGKEIALKEKTKVSDILANPEKYSGKQVLVEGKIMDVCKKAGCWIKIASDKKGESIQFKVKDGVIVFPVSAKGKIALAEGVVFVKTFLQEELIEQAKHEAKEQGKAFDPSTFQGASTVVRIDGEGAVVR